MRCSDHVRLGRGAACGEDDGTVEEVLNVSEGGDDLRGSSGCLRAGGEVSTGFEAGHVGIEAVLSREGGGGVEDEEGERDFGWGPQNIVREGLQTGHELGG